MWVYLLPEADVTPLPPKGTVNLFDPENLGYPFTKGVYAFQRQFHHEYGSILYNPPIDSTSKVLFISRQGEG